MSKRPIYITFDAYFTVFFDVFQAHESVYLPELTMLSNLVVGSGKYPLR